MAKKPLSIRDRVKAAVGSNALRWTFLILIRSVSSSPPRRGS